jgi:hypothetical protein
MNDNDNHEYYPPETVVGLYEPPAGVFAHRDWDFRTDTRLAPKGGGKAEEERVYRPAAVEGFENFRAAGFVKIGGRRLMADGLVSRGGYRRVFSDALLETVWDREMWADRAQDLADLAGQYLGGRTATVFEGLVINPLLGRPGRTVDDLARQFGVTPDRIYKIKNKGKERLALAVLMERQRQLYQLPTRNQLAEIARPTEGPLALVPPRILGIEKKHSDEGGDLRLPARFVGGSCARFIP